LWPKFTPKNYVDNTSYNLQPLDETGTLAAIPSNISTSNTYFDGFPTDQPSWIVSYGASFTNLLSLNGGNYQQLLWRGLCSLDPRTPLAHDLS
jgi:hypothetical protein